MLRKYIFTAENAEIYAENRRADFLCVLCVYFSLRTLRLIAFLRNISN